MLAQAQQAVRAAAALRTSTHFAMDACRTAFPDFFYESSSRSAAKRRLAHWSNAHGFVAWEPRPHATCTPEGVCTPRIEAPDVVMCYLSKMRRTLQVWSA